MASTSVIPDDAETRDLIWKVYQMRCRGNTYPEISEELKIGLATAHKYYRIASEQLLAFDSELAEFYTNEAVSRREMVLAIALQDLEMVETSMGTDGAEIASLSNARARLMIVAGKQLDALEEMRHLRMPERELAPSLVIVQMMGGSHVRLSDLSTQELQDLRQQVGGDFIEGVAKPVKVAS